MLKNEYGLWQQYGWRVCLALMREIAYNWLFKKSTKASFISFCSF
jgi:hypothetical protein